MKTIHPAVNLKLSTLIQGMALCPADQRLQTFIDDYFLDVDGPVTDFP